MCSWPGITIASSCSSSRNSSISSSAAIVLYYATVQTPVFSGVLVERMPRRNFREGKPRCWVEAWLSDLPRGCERVRFGSILLGLKSSFWQPSFEYELERFPKIIGFLLVKSNLKVDEGGVGGRLESTTRVEVEDEGGAPDGRRDGGRGTGGGASCVCTSGRGNLREALTSTLTPA